MKLSPMAFLILVTGGLMGVFLVLQHMESSVEKDQVPAASRLPVSQGSDQAPEPGSIAVAPAPAPARAPAIEAPSHPTAEPGPGEAAPTGAKPRSEKSSCEEKYSPERILADYKSPQSYDPMVVSSIYGELTAHSLCTALAKSQSSDCDALGRLPALAAGGDVAPSQYCLRDYYLAASVRNWVAGKPDKAWQSCMQMAELIKTSSRKAQALCAVLRDEVVSGSMRSACAKMTNEGLISDAGCRGVFGFLDADPGRCTGRDPEQKRLCRMQAAMLLIARKKDMSACSKEPLCSAAMGAEAKDCAPLAAEASEAFCTEKEKIAVEDTSKIGHYTRDEMKKMGQKPPKDEVERLEKKRSVPKPPVPAEMPPQ